MRALTLHGCWAWCVAHAQKNVENRSWLPPVRHIGSRIAIHAGVNAGGEVAAELRAEMCDAPRDWPKSAIVAVCTLAGVISDESDDVLGTLTREEAVRARTAGWYDGPYGWVLSDIRALETPIACKGALGLWTVPSSVELRLRSRG